MMPALPPAPPAWPGGADCLRREGHDDWHAAAAEPPPMCSHLAGPEADDSWHDGGAETPRVRTIFISDVHLGTSGCQAEALLDFLKAYPSAQLYLVGDIIDGWQLRRRWHWPQAHNDVIQKVLRRARKGCQVIYVPGNHDEFARRFVEHHFGGVWVTSEAMHTCADGRRLWVTHGDLYDGVVQCARWLAMLGDAAYTLALELNRHFNAWRLRMGLPYWSISQVLKLKVKRAVSFIDDFEQVLATEARERGADGVVCGHIHHAEMRMIDGTLYCNDGDWVESRSALVEHFDGRLELVHWRGEAGAPLVDGLSHADAARTLAPAAAPVPLQAPLAVARMRAPRHALSAAPLARPR
jgi:UDP-2,3-diacylglucosamine pyrophosphatase LpxH